MLVTGRQLEDLRQVCAELDLFDCVVAENGALIHYPASREERLLGPPPTAEFLEQLAARNVAPLSIGRVLVATS